jgi:acyl-CoA dehydrogenase
MDFTLSPKVVQLQKRVSDFMNEYVYPIEKRVDDEMSVHGKEHTEPEILKEVRKKAKAEGLWNLFMPDDHYGKGLKVAEYAPLSELMGRSPIGSRAFNCMAPDTGNMEILADFGNAEQKKRWLEPCLEGTMRTCYSMTEP